MKRIKRILWVHLPPALIVAVLFLIISIIGAAAYVAFTFEAEVTVKEPLTPVGPTSFVLDIFASEETSYQVTVANAASNDIVFDLIYTIEPDPGAKGFSVSYPNNITAPALGSVVVTVDVAASKSAVPDVYTISLEVDR